ncbi:hypothetical protein [Fastidiosibacter lacustris]|uniref:hypothetical protein n=1 Tax=Fastidiosibacter lacustris TaxID=2056695 RepID=UPI000E35777F|nr:hypothetical protein [Fastidiosibacter lacustris]
MKNICRSFILFNFVLFSIGLAAEDVKIQEKKSLHFCTTDLELSKNDGRNPSNLADDNFKVLALNDKCSGSLS